MPFELRIALRYLTARRKQAFISLISFISVLGVAVGVMALFIALGLMTGLQSEIRAKILGATAHVSVFKARNDPFDNYREVVTAVRQVPGVLGSAPTVYGKVLLKSPAGSAVATLKGILPAYERTVTDLPSQVEEGSMADFDSPGDGPAPVLLGRDLALSLSVGPGDLLTVMSSQAQLTPMGPLPTMKRLRVVGTVRSGLYEFDYGWGYLPLAAAQRLFGQQDQATLVEVRLADIFAVKAAARAIKARLGEGYQTTDWIQMNESLFSALWLEKTAIAITIGLIVMVAALNIVATLILMVMEKHKDVAILVSMGASRGAITRIFMLQGTVIGAFGTAAGALLGWGTCQIMDRYRLLRIPEDVYQISYVPFRLLPGDAAVVIAGALLVCFLATIHPARGASKLDPAESLRYE
ncbi:MAG TPA: ABC transporter permease [Vicinamibacteria bacterium]